MNDAAEMTLNTALLVVVAQKRSEHRERNNLRDQVRRPLPDAPVVQSR
jgi:hypothetical protein